MADFKKWLTAVLPKGPLYEPEEGEGFDQLLDGLAVVLKNIFDHIGSLRTILSARRTQYLDLLEHEYGILSSSLLTEAFRRTFLHSIANKVFQYGSDSNINEALADAGFTDLYAFNNNPAIDLSGGLAPDYMCYLNDGDAYLGDPTAQLGLLSSDIEGFLIVNSWHEDIPYTIPSDSSLWPYIWVLAKAKYDWPLLTASIISLYKAGNIRLFHDYREGLFTDYSGNNNDGIPSSTITTDSSGALLTNVADEKIDVAATEDLSFSEHDFSVIARLDGTYHDPKVQFAALLNQSGVLQIPDQVVIEDPEDPLYRYTGRQDDVDYLEPWGFGETLDLVSVGTNPDLNYGSPCLGYQDDSLFFNQSDYYKHSTDNTYGDITTEDIVLAIVLQAGSTSGATILDKTDGSGVGYKLIINASNQLEFIIHDGANTANIISAALTSGTWYFATLYIDKSGSGQWYVGRTASGSAVAVSSVGSLTNTDYLCIGADRTGANGYDAAIAYIDVRIKAAWLSTHLQAATAELLFMSYIGVYPQYFDNGLTLDLSNTVRSDEAYLRKYDGTQYTLFKVCEDWIRFEQIKDDIGVVNGVFIESDCQNKNDYSTDLTNWTTVNASESLETIEAPDRSIGVYGFIRNSGTGLTMAARTESISAGNVSFSAYVKPGTSDWIWLYVACTGDPEAWFNVTTGEIGTENNCKADIEGPYNGGFYRCSITFNTVSTTVEEGVAPVDDDEETDCTGNGSDINCYMWGMQLENMDYPSSLIHTNGSPVSRSEDDLIYEFDSNFDADYDLTCSCLLIPNNDGDYLTTYNIKVGIMIEGSADASVFYINGDNTRGFEYSYSIFYLTPVEGTTPINDGQRKHVQFNYTQQDGNLLLEQEVEISNPSSYNPPNDPIIIDVGVGAFGAYYLNGHIKNILIHEDYMSKSITGQLIADNRSDYFNSWFLTTIGQKIFLRLNDQWCSIGDFVDDDQITVAFSIEDGVGIEAYLDGVLVDKILKLYESNSTDGSSALTIGNSNIEPGFLSFESYIANLIILDCVLTAAQALDFYNNMAISDTYVLEPGSIESEKLERLKKIILQKKPLGSWCFVLASIT